MSTADFDPAASKTSENHKPHRGINHLGGAGFSSASYPDGHRAPLLLLGIVAAVCVLFRIVDPPTPAGALLALSLREGAWLALLGSAAMVAGSLWPENLGSRIPSDAKLERAWSGLSGWTPEG